MGVIVVGVVVVQW